MDKFLAFLIVAACFFASACSNLPPAPVDTHEIPVQNDRRTEDAIETDIAIRGAIYRLIDSDENWSMVCHIVTHVFNGVVLVTGETPTPDYKNRLITALRVIPDVKLVHDNLAIDYPSDFESRAEDNLLAEKIKSELRRLPPMPGFNATQVKVITENRTVYLMGLVRRPEGKAIIDVARQQEGVAKVVTIFEYLE